VSRERVCNGTFLLPGRSDDDEGRASKEGDAGVQEGDTADCVL
jgi:hypothetical protein